MKWPTLRLGKPAKLWEIWIRGNWLTLRRIILGVGGVKSQSLNIRNPQGVVEVQAAQETQSQGSSVQRELPRNDELWERLSKMEDDKQNFEKQQTDMMSMLVLNVVKMQ